MIATLEAPTVSEPLTWHEICERYPDEWVCLAEVGWLSDNEFEFTTARVIGHGKKSRDPYDQAAPVWHLYGEIGHYFTGELVPAPAPHHAA